MTTELEEQELTPEQQELKEIEERIEFLEKERINLRVAPFVFDRLLKQADFYGVSIEDHCVSILLESLDENVGKPSITGPSNLSGVVTKKVMGYTGSVQRG